MNDRELFDVITSSILLLLVLRDSDLMYSPSRPSLIPKVA